ncbi:ABC transporter permease [Fulvivirga sedimenti]|uniref:ABC transporter permease n=1 Tax=Fulvivirga sedimenti TaxID=2879465 RepID=A0A9X1HPK3_9BACT|nr:ABC transporter permease [Fulvivirga sedimenti]MCA6073979.1 ABC transporter permease [Fulvivirga sedimenti]
MHPEPPHRFTRFLEWFCPPELCEAILGDLYEQFEMDIDQVGQRRANRRYRWNVIRFFRPGILFRNRNRIKLFNNMMWSNYLKVAFRNLYRRRLYSLINAVGLSIGIAFCGLIYLYIQNEKSFDKFQTNGDRIFRIEEYGYDDWGAKETGELYRYSAYVQIPVIPTLKAEVPQVEFATRFSPHGEGIFTYGDKIFNEEITFTDKDFFQIFSFELLEGNREKLFNDKNEVVITPSIVEKYFDGESPLGKTIELSIFGDNQPYVVTGVIEEAPANSSITYSLLIPQENRPFFEQSKDRWNNFNTPSFVMLYKNADMEQFEANLDIIVEKYMGENLERWREDSSLPEDLELFKFKYTRFTDIHMDTKVEWTRSSDPQYSYILGGIALFILLIACINYISLALTTSASRRIEVGIRKAIGAQRNQLLAQFSFESMLLALISMIVGLGLITVFLPYFNEFTTKEIVLGGPDLIRLTLVSLVITLLVGFLSGGYPALFLSAIRPTQVLKGNFTGRLNAGFTKPLVILQFTLSAVLIISSLIMYRQMKFITTKDLGYESSQVVVIPTQVGYNPEGNRIIANFRNALNNEPDIESVSGTTTAFSQGWSRNGYKYKGEDKTAYVFGVDPNYIPLLNIEILEGRNFDPAIASDSNALIVNESLVRDLGWEDPLAERLNWREDSLDGHAIIGVVKDYHFLSLESGIYPMFLSINNDDVGYLNYILVRIRPGAIDNAMGILKEKWKDIAPDKPFDYTFLDEDVANQYASYKRWMNIMGLATGFAILISCLGLFGLAGINAVNRTKEIGIRKVMGAEIHNIFVLLNRQFIWLALISFIIATPLSYYLMNQWLSEFEFAVEISWQIFAISMLAGLSIALLTVSYHAIRAANINPSETLKYE